MERSWAHLFAAMGFLDRIRNRNAPEESQNSSEFLGTDLAGIGLITLFWRSAPFSNAKSPHLTSFA